MNSLPLESLFKRSQRSQTEPNKYPLQKDDTDASAPTQYQESLPRSQPREINQTVVSDACTLF